MAPAEKFDGVNSSLRTAGQCPYTSGIVKIRVDSDEYRCWHEVGHAVVCLHFGGDVEFIEFLEGDAVGAARTRCEEFPGTERSVACGGFAAEVLLLRKGLAELGSDNERNINEAVFNNAFHDRQAFCGYLLGPVVDQAEQTAFMHHAVGPEGSGGVIPILEHYFSRMQVVVRELLQVRRLEGTRIKELLAIGAR